MGELVESYAGFMSPERPRAFVWQGQRLEVSEIVSRARLPDGHWFRVRSRGGELFDLTYFVETGEWAVGQF